MDKKVALIVQARMASTRLPGKILRQVLNRPLLSYLVERLKRVRHNKALLIATTTNPLDDVVVAQCQKEGVSYFRGNEEDVLDRYVKAAEPLNIDTIVRITADCPLIDPQVIDDTIAFYFAQKVDYASNSLVPSFPRGMDTEVFSLKALQRAAQEAHLPAEREHVTLYLYRHPERFRLASYRYPTDQSHYRLTVDTPEDLQLVAKILENLYPADPNFDLPKILHLLKLHPEWAEINRHIPQKKV